MQRELTRRIIAAAMVKAHPNPPIKSSLANELLMSLEDYRKLLGKDFERSGQAAAGINKPAVIVNAFLKDEWREAWSGENDPFDIGPPGVEDFLQQVLEDDEHQNRDFVTECKKAHQGLSFGQGRSSAKPDVDRDYWKSKAGHSTDDERSSFSGYHSDSVAHRRRTSRRFRPRDPRRESRTFYAYDAGTRHLLGRIDRRSAALPADKRKSTRIDEADRESSISPDSVDSHPRGHGGGPPDDDGGDSSGGSSFRGPNCGRGAFRGH